MTGETSPHRVGVTAGETGEEHSDAAQAVSDQLTSGGVRVAPFQAFRPQVSAGQLVTSVAHTDGQARVGVDAVRSAGDMVAINSATVAEHTGRRHDAST